MPFIHFFLCVGVHFLLLFFFGPVVYVRKSPLFMLPAVLSRVEVLTLGLFFLNLRDVSQIIYIVLKVLIYTQGLLVRRSGFAEWNVSTPRTGPTFTNNLKSKSET